MRKLGTVLVLVFFVLLLKEWWVHHPLQAITVVLFLFLLRWWLAINLFGWMVTFKNVYVYLKIAVVNNCIIVVIAAVWAEPLFQEGWLWIIEGPPFDRIYPSFAPFFEKISLGWIIGFVFFCLAIGFYRRGRPLIRLRSQLTLAAKTGAAPPIPLYRLATNIRGNWSTFGQEFRRLEEIHSVHILLNSVEAKKIEKRFRSWLNENLSRFVFLIDPTRNSSEINEYSVLAEQYASQPQIALMGLFLEQPAEGQGWKRFWDFLDAAGEVRVIERVQLTAQPALANILAALPESALNSRQVVKEMGPQFLELHGSMAKGPTPVAEMYRKLCQVDSLPQAVFLLFDSVEALLRLTAFSLLCIRGEAKDQAQSWGRRYGSIRNVASLIVDQLDDGPLPEAWQRHFIRIKEGLPKELFTQDHPILREFLHPIPVECHNRLGFRGIASLITVLRNKTKGHGVITEEVGQVLAAPLFRFFMMLAYLTRIDELNYSRPGTDYQVKCLNSKAVMVSPFVWSPPDTDDVFLLLEFVKHKKGKHKMVYVDYISGDLIRPELKEVVADDRIYTG
jgi:hypothetical protein